jgi:hypothetical protein
MMQGTRAKKMRCGNFAAKACRNDASAWALQKYLRLERHCYSLRCESALFVKTNPHMITFYLDDAIAKVWHDDTIPCIFTKVHRTMTSADLERLSKTVSETVKKLKRRDRGILFSVTDLHSCENWSADMVKDFVLAVVSAEYKAGIARKFVVRPADSHSRNALVHGLVAAPNMNTSVHDDLLEILREIERFKSTNPNSLQENNHGMNPFRRLVKLMTSREVKV